MKKIISLLLIAVLALSLVACGPSAPAEDDSAKEMQIVGTWVMNNMVHEFREDHTGTIMQGSGIKMQCDWTYAKGEYTIGYTMGEYTATITEKDDGTLVLHFNGGEYTLQEAE